MDTVEHHLETLFANEPETPAVAQAKKEAADRLNQLFNDWTDNGATPSAAASEVIAHTPTIASILPHYDPAVRPVSGLDVPTVSAYWERRAVYARGLATGVGLIIMATGVVPAMMALGARLGIHVEGLSAIGFFGTLAAGIVTIVRHRSLFAPLERKVRRARVSLAAKKLARRRLASYRVPFTYALCGGISLFFLSLIVPMLCSGVPRVGDELGGTLLFACVALGVSLIVYASTIRHGYQHLMR